MRHSSPFAFYLPINSFFVLERFACQKFTFGSFRFQGEDQVTAALPAVIAQEPESGFCSPALGRFYSLRHMPALPSFAGLSAEQMRGALSVHKQISDQ